MCRVVRPLPKILLSSVRYDVHKNVHRRSSAENERSRTLSKIDMWLLPVLIGLDLATTLAPQPTESNSVDVAMRELAHADVFVGYVGPTMQPGETLQRLAVVTALGARAMPYLLRLARSRNPVARAATADGFGKMASAAARAALRRLLRDHAKVELLSGCLGDERREVSEFARDALAAQKKMPNQVRR